MGAFSLRPRSLALLALLLGTLARARGQQPPAAAAAAILNAMASRAQQNSLSQTLIALMALAAAEVQDPLPQGQGGERANNDTIASSSSSSSSPSSSPSSSSSPPPLLQAAAVVVGAAQTSDNATTTVGGSSSSSSSRVVTNSSGMSVDPYDDALLFRAALRDHLEELVGRQQGQFVNALSFGQDGEKAAAAAPGGGSAGESDDDDNDDFKNGLENKIIPGAVAENKKQERRDALASLLAKVAERAAGQGPASIKLHDKLLLGLGRAARAAATSQPGAGPCGRYSWDAGGEYTPASWQGPVVSLSLSLGSCALVPSLEGPGAALTAGSAWTNAVGELACLGPGLSYSLSPLVYTSVGLSGESLTAPACRLSASFGPAVSLTLTRSAKQGAKGGGNGGSGGGGNGGNGGGNGNGEGKDTYSSEGAFLAAAVLNGTLDRRIRGLERALAAAAGLKGSVPMWRKGGVEEEEAGEEEGGGDYELAWEKGGGDKGGGDALRRKGMGRHLAAELLKHVGWGQKKDFVNALADGGGQASGDAAAAEAPPAFENRIG